jgi:hypothetical protein
MKICLLILLLAMTACQSMPTSSARKAFSPDFSAAELSYVFKSVLKFVESPSVGAPDSAKKFTLERGGLRNVPLLVQLPDQSYITIKILSGELLISGYSNLEVTHWINISKQKDGYYLRDSQLPSGLGCGAEFLISLVGGHVSDEKVPCVDAF